MIRELFIFFQLKKKEIFIYNFVAKEKTKLKNKVKSNKLFKIIQIMKHYYAQK